MASSKLYSGRVWYPYTQMQALEAPREIVRGEGVWLYAGDGSRHLDAISSWWVTLHGHAEPRIVEAIARQARTLEQVILAEYTHPLAEELAERLVRITPPGLEHVFYSDDGSTAVEVALKMALQCWQQRRLPGRRRILALENAYHGDTLAAMSVSEATAFTAPFAEWMFPVERVPADDLGPLEALLAARGEEVAALIVEPLLQGVGGMRVQTPEFLRGLRRLCDQHQVLLIADEVLTGFGRTGTMFACEQAGISPDVMCLSKGLTGGALPMAATLCTDAVYEAFLSGDRERTLFHGHSFTGNALGCAAAMASLDVFAEEPVMERIAAIAATHSRCLERLRRHPRVRAVRQAGTVAAVELRDAGQGYLAEVALRLRRYYEQRGVLLRPLGPVVYVLPPYRTQTSELEWVWEVITTSLNEIA
ncbi:MAG: adenosylmethionine--8-amino-7-oxononanoate transaminase [Terriglobales bacterium]